MVYEQLHNLIYRVDLVEISNALRKMPWDSENELVKLESRHLESVLSRYLAGELSASSLEEWANLIEGRDDINYEKFVDRIHVLANPVITEELSSESAKTMLEMLRDV